jgi:flagellar hook-associated protein 1 FlgK
MANLFASIAAAGSGLSAFERALEVTQNNVTNASTPGFARQRLVLEAAPASADGSLVGGVQAGALLSARDEYAEQEVRSRLETLGYFESKNATLEGIENCFDITGSSGMSGALNGLFSSFSAWSVSPNSSSARRSVLQAAESAAAAFHQIAGDLGRILSDTGSELSQTIAQVNQLAGVIRDCNAQRLQTGSDDPAVDAKIHSALEQLAELANFSAIRQDDGSYTVLLGGQSALVVGQNAYTVSLDVSTPSDPPPTYPDASAPAHVLDAAGIDITGQLRAGKLGGLLEVRNQLLPSLIGDAYQQGDLNKLAQALADRVNQILEAGSISDGPPAQPGVALFTYDAAHPTAIASSIAISSSITPDQLAAIDPGPPYVSNGVTLKLADLGSQAGGTGGVDGVGLVDFYSGMAAKVGREVNAASEGSDLQKQLAAQARTMRDQISGVSLDEEAVMLIQFQRAYQAAARMISILDQLTETAVNLTS